MSLVIYITEIVSFIYFSIVQTIHYKYCNISTRTKENESNAKKLDTWIDCFTESAQDRKSEQKSHYCYIGASIARGEEGKMDVVFDIETTGLIPLETEDEEESRITAIGVKTKDEEIIFTDKDESKILNDFFNFLRKFNNFRLISFNGFKFDNLFLIVRSFKHGVKMVDFRGKGIDLRLVLTNGDKYATGTLEDFSFLIDAGEKFGNMTGKEVIELWHKNEIEVLKTYLFKDLRITYAIYERLKMIGLIDER